MLLFVSPINLVASQKEKVLNLLVIGLLGDAWVQAGFNINNINSLAFECLDCYFQHFYLMPLYIYLENRYMRAFIT